MKHAAKLAGQFRHVLTFIGGALVTNGLVDPDVATAADAIGLDTVLGAGLVVVSFALSFFSPAKLVGHGDLARAPLDKRALVLPFMLPLALSLALAGCYGGAGPAYDPTLTEEQRQAVIEQERELLRQDIADLAVIVGSKVDVPALSPEGRTVARIICRRLATRIAWSRGLDVDETVGICREVGVVIPDAPAEGG